MYHSQEFFSFCRFMPIYADFCRSPPEIPKIGIGINRHKSGWPPPDKSRVKILQLITFSKLFVYTWSISVAELSVILVGLETSCTNPWLEVRSTKFCEFVSV